MLETVKLSETNELWINPKSNKFENPSVGLVVEGIIDKLIQDKKRLTYKQLETIVNKLVSIVEIFNSLSDIHEIEKTIKEIEYNLSSFNDNFLPPFRYNNEEIVRYFNRTILKGKDRIIMISLNKIENILKTSTNNDLTEEQRKELEELLINCNQIIEIDNPQKIEIYIKKLEELNSMINDIGIDDSGIRTLLYKSRGTILSLDLKQVKKEN